MGRIGPFAGQPEKRRSSFVAFGRNVNSSIFRCWFNSLFSSPRLARTVFRNCRSPQGACVIQQQIERTFVPKPDFSQAFWPAFLSVIARKVAMEVPKQCAIGCMFLTISKDARVSSVCCWSRHSPLLAASACVPCRVHRF